MQPKSFKDMNEAELLAALDTLTWAASHVAGYLLDLRTAPNHPISHSTFKQLHELEISTHKTHTGYYSAEGELEAIHRTYDMSDLFALEHHLF